jgi:hypothetical protein
VLKTPFGRGLALGVGLGLGVADAITDGLAVAVALCAADTLAEGLAVPPPQPEMAMATIPLAKNVFATRTGSTLDLNTVNL